MPIKIGNYTFEGPYGEVASLRNQSGVYAILARRSADERFIVIDIGESGGVRERVDTHDREVEWTRACGTARLWCAAYYCDGQARMRIERELRRQYAPACGVR